MKQISVLVKSSAEISYIGDVLGKEEINICAISLGKKNDLKVMRFVTDDTEKTIRVLKSLEMPFEVEDVIGIEVPDHPGGLASMLKPLSSAGIDVEYLYTSLRHHKENAVLIMRTDKTEETINILAKNWFKVIESEDLI